MPSAKNRSGHWVYTALFDIEKRDDDWVADAASTVLTGMTNEDADELADLLTHREWCNTQTH